MKQRQRPKIQHRMEYSQLSNKISDGSDEETELFTRKSFVDVPTVEKGIEEGDTLQALSIRYQCPIAELKRLNNIHRENEIFAKRTIKVPIRPFSIALATVHISGSTSPNENSNLSNKGEIDAEILKSKLNSKILIAPSTSNNKLNNLEVNEVIFNSDVKPVIKNCDNIDVNLSTEVSEEEISLLPRSEVRVSEVVVSKLSCSGADADISWIALIVCIVIVIFAVPLIYVFYIAEHPEQYHHSNS